METKEIIVIVILLLLVIGAALYLSIEMTNYNECMSTESNGCPTFVCGQTPITTHPTCVGENTTFPPYRTTSDGTIVCQPTGITPAIPPPTV